MDMRASVSTLLLVLISLHHIIAHHRTTLHQSPASNCATSANGHMLCAGGRGTTTHSIQVTPQYGPHIIRPLIVTTTVCFQPTPTATNTTATTTATNGVISGCGIRRRGDRTEQYESSLVVGCRRGRAVVGFCLCLACDVSLSIVSVSNRC